MSIIDNQESNKDDDIKHEEYQYLKLIKHIIKNGEHRDDRTSTGTLSIFAPNQLRFSLLNGVLPLLTTKRVYYKAVLHELLFFIRGDTNSNNLKKVNVNIWDKNSSREYLDNHNLQNYKEGELGPVYGFQWRHFGATYLNCESDYKDKGYDQLSKVIEMIKTDPFSRRIIMSAWNPCDLDKMVLPPCHVLVQFYVSKPKDKNQKPLLSCILYQRSCDIGLGVPFNIASYSLLVHMIAQVTNTQPHEFIYTMGDAHIYLDHIEALKSQIQREPKPFPTINFKRKVDSIDDFKFDDIEIVDYKPHGKIVMNMSA